LYTKWTQSIGRLITIKGKSPMLFYYIGGKDNKPQRVYLLQIRLYDL